ncbi:MAG: family 10 glycosylhydrolase [Bacteroidota bacterium]|nr:family 10 glycosylhydrolase [Bacteroidota bacterium]
MRLCRFRFTSALVLFFSTTMVACAQHAPAPKYEFRGAWIATVINLDWPAQGASSDYQKAQLRNIMTRLKDAGINAVFFQVRSEADAMYESGLEPWSYWLTGRQGWPPNPFYDPLRFAIEEAHKHGMELHAWFNPYRAERGSGYSNAGSHVTITRPEWIYKAGPLSLLDPGQAAVRDYITTIVMDVADRYDIDGVHFDDYFYPYPPNQIGAQDYETFQQESRGFTSLGDWRRDNVNLLMAQISDSLRTYWPAVKFGISPFGIWRNGVPSGIRGLDAYDVIYADPLAWIEAESIDYLVPQLYWRFAVGTSYRGQDYAKLAPWWAQQMDNGRHLYIGHGLYRAERGTFSGALFPATEIPEQVQFNRDHIDILGSVFFRSSNITAYNSQNFVSTMKEGLYKYPALTPPMAWKSQEAPSAPANLAYEWTGDAEITLSWEAPSPAPARYAVYRVRSANTPDPGTAMVDAQNLLAFTGRTSWADRPGLATELYHYFVQSVSSNSIESGPTNMVSLAGRATFADYAPERPDMVLEAYPSIFSDKVIIAYSLDEPADVSIEVVDIVGRTVRRLIGAQRRSSGDHTITWDGYGGAGPSLASGMYWVVISGSGHRIARPVVLRR